MLRTAMASAILLAAANFAAPAALAAVGAQVTTPSGLKYQDKVIGAGRAAAAGDYVEVQYTGWLQAPGGAHGKQFDSSVGRGEPFRFQLGQHMVIQGWDEGVAGMQPGGKRTLTIPAALGYGDAGAGDGLIPPGATLIFDVELVKID